ncbi:MAG: DNA-directed RNA polymerase subunit omega [Clostridia bacterium]|nr:DNA-directed RNA polymerase subunit omega [Clostridia bacterium]
MEKNMVKPSLSSLMEKENVNRYALVVATAKTARQITDDYINQREYYEKNSGKDSDKNVANVVKPQYRDEKAVKNAIDELYNDEYRIIKSTLPAGMGREDAVEAEVEASEETI